MIKSLTKLYKRARIVILSIILVFSIALLIINEVIMTKKEQRNYKEDHKLAKLICAIVNTFLFVSILEIDKPILFFIINLTYFFGVNSMAYIIEAVRKHKHKHDVI